MNDRAEKISCELHLWHGIIIEIILLRNARARSRRAAGIDSFQARGEGETFHVNLFQRAFFDC